MNYTHFLTTHCFDSLEIFFLFATTFVGIALGTTIIMLFRKESKSDETKEDESPEKKMNSIKRKTIEETGKKKKKEVQFIELQAEIWADIVECVPFLDMAKGLSLANRQMHAICAPHIYEQNRRVVNMMGIEKKEDGDNEDEKEEEDDEKVDNDDGSSDAEEAEEKELKKGPRGKEKEKNKQKGGGERLKVQKYLWDSEYSELVEIPLATVAPPPNILGFRKIHINHLNDEVLSFLRLIKPLLQSSSDPMLLDADYGRRRSSSDPLPFRFEQLLDLHKILQGPVVGFSANDSHFVDPYWRHMRPFMLSIQFLTFYGGYWYGTKGAAPILARWLETDREDGQPRYVYIRWCHGHDGQCLRFLNRLRESFNTAQSTSSFIVEFDDDDFEAQENDNPPPQPFLERNGLNERLAFDRHRHGGHSTLLLRRFPALPTAIGDTWMDPVLERTRRVLSGSISKFEEFRLNAEGELEGAPMNHIKLALEWPYSPF